MGIISGIYLTAILIRSKIKLDLLGELNRLRNPA